MHTKTSYTQPIKDLLNIHVLLTMAVEHHSKNVANLLIILRYGYSLVAT